MDTVTGLFAGLGKNITNALSSDDNEGGAMSNLATDMATSAIGAFLGAAGHAAWTNRDTGSGKIMVSPTIHCAYAPQTMTLDVDYDSKLCGDGGVMCVSDTTGSQSLYLDLLKKFKTTSARERLGGVMHTDISTIVQSEIINDGQCPKSTSETMFLWMAKRIGRPILIFCQDPGDRSFLLLSTIYPCVVYEEDTEHHWTKGGPSAAGVHAKEPVCLLLSDSKYRLLVQCDPKQKDALTTGLIAPT